MKKTLGALCAAALIGSLAAALPTALPTATAAGDDVQIQPRSLDRGEDSAIPHLEGRRVVDGDISVRVRGKQRYLLGAAGDGYVVQVLRKETYQLVRVAPGRKQRVLVEGSPGLALLSDDGETIAVIDRYAHRSSIEVRSALDGQLLSDRGGFRGYPNLLDLDGDHLVIASFEKGARDWDWRADSIERITRKSAYEADLSSDRLAFFTKDPYNGGCSVTTTLSRPRTRLWRSCREAVLEFSPDGQRIVTTHKLADGIGPSKVWERMIDGEKLASYTVGAYFGLVGWESESDLLLDAYGRKNGATVRCSEGTCERASSVRATPMS
ncbi:hypothetical protein BH09ACT12_BH09ACT12_09710 [soil metagenome]